MPTKSICVFAGSNTGGDPALARAAEALGTEIAARGYGLVYGGASIGLMAAVAKSALDAGGHVVGVIPDFLLAKEIAHERLSELKVVSSMHERKALMARLSSGFIALPGGFGTVEEFFEVLTWAQLGLHPHPCGLLNVNGYYDALLTFLDHTVAQRLLRPQNRAMGRVAPGPQ